MQMNFKIVFLRLNPSATGGAERYMSRLREALKVNNEQSIVRRYHGSLWLSSWIKALRFNSYAKKLKQKDELYFSLERIDSADIYRAGDGVHKIYRSQKRFWWLNPLNFIYPYLEKRCFLNSIKIIANSHFVARQIEHAYGIDPQKISVIYNGVKLPDKLDKISAKQEICKNLGLNDKLPLLLFVGSGFKRKGVSELLAISKALNELNHEHSLIIIGKDKRLKNYEKMAKNMGVNAVFMGEQKGVNKFYEASDIFIFPTHYEPFSNVVLEALSYGCISFSTTQNGASEVLNPEWVLSGNSKDDAQKIASFFALNRMQKASDEAVQIAQKFDIEKNAKATLLVIKEVLEVKTNMLKCARK